jgi:hypothetical protein
MPSTSSQALRTAVVQGVLSDPAFQKELQEDAAKAIETRFGRQPYRVKVVRETETELSVLIPHKTPSFARTIERTVRDIGERPPTRGQFEAVIVHRAWNDPAFLQLLQTDPRAAMDSELKKHGSGVPEGRSVKVYVEQPNECVIVVPRATMRDAAELTDAELEAVAGGEATDSPTPPFMAGAIVSIIDGPMCNEWYCS